MNYARLLDVVVEAKQAPQAVQATVQQEAIYKAKRAVTEATADLNSFQGDVALSWIHGLRWAMESFSESVNRHLGLDELAEVVAKLERVTGRKGVAR